MRTCAIVFLVCSLAGCSAQRIGIRPDEPPFTLLSGDPCNDYVRYASYVQTLQESYYARSSLNRVGSYAAGGVVVAGTAGSAGLAAEGASSVASMGLISIAQAALSLLFNVVDNQTLAAIYTVASNGMGTALETSFATMSDTVSPNACLRAHVQLRHAVNEAKNNLELARTDASSAALQRALAQSIHYQSIVKQFPGVMDKTNPKIDSAASPLDAILNRLEDRIRTLEGK